MKPRPKKFVFLTIVGSVFIVLLFASFFAQRLFRGKKPSQTPGFNQPTVLGAFMSQNSPLRGPEKADAGLGVGLVNLPGLDKISAKAVLIYDAESGEVLVEKNGNEKLPIASLTKLLTAWVVYRYGSLTGSVEVKPQNFSAVRPVLHLQAGDLIKVQDLFNAMLVGSCNDAAKVLADYISNLTGKDFVFLMNQSARELGMQNSNFSNPLGFDYKDNHSTAEDLKILVEATQRLSSFTILGRKLAYQFTSQEGNIYKTSTTNQLLANHPEIQAIKTGYTPDADGSLITKVALGSRQIIFMVIDSQHRDQDTLAMIGELKEQLNK